jgi:hypothetical protein
MLLLDMTPERYRRVTEDVAKTAILEAATPKPMLRNDIFEKVIPQFFMQHKRKVYRRWIDELFQAGRLFADPSVKLHRDQLNERVLLSARPWR